MHSRLSRPGGLVLTLCALLTGNLAAAERYWPPITTPPTGVHLPGKWVWADLITRDVGEAVEFYGQVFGWTFETYGPKDDLQTYTLVLADGEPIGGMVFDWSKSPTERSARWVGQISVPDVKAAESQVRSGGGHILEKPQQLGERGQGALFIDPEGAMFAVIRSDTGDPEDWLGGPNTWLWVELWSDDPVSMSDFYKDIGGYEVQDEVFEGTMFGYHLVSGGYPRAGIRAKSIEVPSAWVPYVRVDNVATTVSRAMAAGAHVVAAPHVIRGTTAALLLDPSGAPFAVAEWPAR